VGLRLMLGLFGSRLPIDDELEFQLATFKWLIREFDSVDLEPYGC
jgi:hypothetical protein